MAIGNTFCNLAVESINGLSPYQPGKPIDELQRELGLDNIVKLASNENPLGASSAVKNAIANSIDKLSQYPDGSGFYLKKALSEKLGVSADIITLGNGSNDVLDVIARVFLSKGREAVYSQYAFVVYALATQSVGATARVAQSTAYGHDLNAMAALVNEKTSVVFIANPNNPTGTWLEADELESFIKRMPAHVIVVLDEAYCEYLDQGESVDTIGWLNKYANLVITRTFSKAYGLAGLRVGYAVSHPEVTDLLNRVRQPFNVNSLALVAAEAAVKDEQYINKSRELNCKGLRQLSEGFDLLGLSYIPSVGNFISLEVGEKTADVYLKLLQHGVIVRPIATYNLPTFLRVSVGLPAENKMFLVALEKVLQDV
ncbi:MAG: histidinol-phosphate transaminase [Cycloclasticus sp. symbiont of Poecilosclerida sp. N]|nr:MAG: histidinol-phosphate transaminase [Cycloclasticus sp. symbiont of Poecilosclerida sp. N]